MIKKTDVAVLALAVLAANDATAEITEASATHFVLRHEAHSALAADVLWRRLLKPADWWHPDHTYSGNAANLTLEARAGGLWREDWEGGSVEHGRVVFIKPGEQLRLNAPFGPLLEIGAYTIWTISIRPDGDGSKVVFDEVANAPPSANMEEMAKAVDFVKGEAIRRLVLREEN